MERDAAISHGASAFLRERLMLVSDGYQTVFCKNCGTFAVNDASTKKYKECRLCRDDKNFGRCTIPYVYKLLIHYLAAIGINLRPEFLTSEEYANKIFRNRGLPGADIGDIFNQLADADAILAEEEDEAAEPEDQDYDDIYNE